MGDFSQLDPFTIIEAAESVLDRGFSNIAYPLPSYINRVFELEDDDGVRFVIKFYRPGRWNIDAILEEHRFILDCYSAEIPVVPPIELAGGTTLAKWEDIPFAVFPKRSGRDFDSDDSDAYLRLGRLLGRLHMVSVEQPVQSRLTLTPDGLTRNFVKELIDGGHINDGHRNRFEDTCNEIIELSIPLFKDVSLIRCHGDCHRGNILDRPGEGLLLIDFDDMLAGPAVHDMWMLLPGRLDDSGTEMELLLEGYNEFKGFRREELQLIEPLRAMRMIYYLAWIARQKSDYNFPQHHADWGSEHFWQNEISDLQTQLEEIKDLLGE